MMEKIECKRIRSGLAGLLAVCTVMGMGGLTVSAGQNIPSVSGCDGEYVSVSDNDYEEAENIISLQTPDNLDFTIDPWNLSGHGQIFSEQFVIKNCGDRAITLCLQDIACSKADGVTIVEDVGEIYIRDAANIYLEMVFDSGNVLTLSAEGREYGITLEAGGEFVFRFAGAVNEKASEGWTGKEISVALKYVCVPV